MKRCALIIVLTVGLLISHQQVSSSSQSLGGVALTQVSPRIVTPNGDSSNDVIFFRFDDALSGLPIESAVYDLHGAKVSDLQLNSSDDTLLTWDARDDGGNVMPAGIYVYSIEIGQKRATGTVVVAR